ncbi:MAG: hypothetical protein HWN65_13215 [Candidatus Helarchaeota archaeon]|nr:hypothetical protein [Candidatus Helarchaeota archaeon]
MGILGLTIQRTNGIPIVTKTWTDKLSGFTQIDSMLTAGFMSAITSFADSFDQNIDFIQISPKKEPDSNGISVVLNYFSDVMMICFTEPYLFLDKVTMKLRWIYENLIQTKLDDLDAVCNVFTITPEEEMYIEDILFDKVARILIEERKEQIISVLEDLENHFAQEEIRGFSINSFDNSIIFTYHIDEQELENLLCNMGKGGYVKDWEVQYKPVWIEKNPVLVSYTNSAVKIQISDIIMKEKAADQEEGQLYFGVVPLYYYIITDTDCSIGPIMEKINTSLHPIFVDYKIDASKLDFELEI